MDGAQVGVLKETHKVGLGGLLESHHGGALETQIGLEVLGDFPDETLEGQLADEQLGGLLVSPDLPKGHSAGPVSVGLLDSTGGGGGLPGSLGGQLLPGSLSSGGLTVGLLGTSHGDGSDDTDAGARCDPAYIHSPAPARGRHCVQCRYLTPPVFEFWSFGAVVGGRKHKCIVENITHSFSQILSHF